jgi:hypothetical protein
MKRNNYKAIIDVLLELHKDHPSYEMGKHFSIALSEYKDIWNVPDKEILSALKKYQQEISEEADITEDYISQIIQEGMNLDTILDDENEEE